MRILVPLDGSETAEAAVPFALQLARKANGTLMLLSVISPRMIQDPAPAEPDVIPITEAKSYLETARCHLMPNCADVLTAVWRGTPAAAIVSAAEAYRVDLIAMTTHGRTGRQREMFGSVADAVLRSAPMQVLVVRPRHDAADARIGPTEAVTAYPL
jgi:nucleotide-binding universal stress UspA family protein